MQQLTYVAPGRYEWSDAPEPTLETAGSALVRPIVVASCDLDAAVARGLAPLPPGYADELAALEAVDRRVLVIGAFSIGLYAAAFAVGLGATVDYVDTDPMRLTSAEQLGACVHESIPTHTP